MMLKKAIVKMLEHGEFEKMIKYEQSWIERKKIKKDKQLAENMKEYGVDKVPEINVLVAIKSVETFRNAVAYMKSEK